MIAICACCAKEFEAPPGPQTGPGFCRRCASWIDSKSGPAKMNGGDDSLLAADPVLTELWDNDVDAAYDLV